MVQFNQSPTGTFPFALCLSQSNLISPLSNTTTIAFISSIMILNEGIHTAQQRCGCKVHELHTGIINYLLLKIVESWKYYLFKEWFISFDWMGATGLILGHRGNPENWRSRLLEPYGPLAKIILQQYWLLVITRHLSIVTHYWNSSE